MPIFGERHLPSILAEYEAHYNGHRPPPQPPAAPAATRPPVADLSHERIKRRAVPGALINEYERSA
jgi:putative transposase